MAKRKLLTLDEAIQLLNEAHQVDPIKIGKNLYSKQTIYNAIRAKRLERYGPAHLVQLDPDQVLKVFGPKKVS